MLSGKQIHLHQALGLGPTWVRCDAQIIESSPQETEAESVVIAAQPQPHLTASATTSAAAAIDSTKSVLPKPHRTDVMTPSRPSDLETVSRKVNARTANLLAIIAKAQHQSPQANKSPDATLVKAMNDVSAYQLDDWDTLNGKIQQCQLCDLSESRRQAMTSSVSEDCRLIVVVPQPSLQDDINGYLISGDIEAMWHKLIAAIGLNMQQVYVTSAIKCAANIQLVATQQHASQCRPYLERQLQLLPKVPVLLLAHNQAPLWQRLQTWCGSERIFRIAHPSTMQRNPDIKKQAWETLKQLKARLEQP